MLMKSRGKVQKESHSKKKLCYRAILHLEEIQGVSSKNVLRVNCFVGSKGQHGNPVALDMLMHLFIPVNPRSTHKHTDHNVNELTRESWLNQIMGYEFDVRMAGIGDAPSIHNQTREDLRNQCKIDMFSGKASSPFFVLQSNYTYQI